METYSHDSVRSVKCFFDTITVMYINVNIKDSFVDSKQLENTNDDIVYIAESTCFRFFSMMKTTSPVDGNVSLVMDY